MGTEEIPEIVLSEEEEALGDTTLPQVIAKEDVNLPPNIPEISLSEEEAAESDQTLPQVIAEEDDSIPFETEFPPMIVGDDGDLDLTSIMDNPTALSEEQSAYIEEQRSVGRQSFEAAANRLAMKNFDRALGVINVPHAMVQAATLTAMQGGSANDIVQMAMNQYDNVNDVRQQNYPELIFEAATRSGIHPTFARKTALAVGAPMEFLSPLDPLTGIDIISNLKVVKKPISIAMEFAKRKPMEWTKGVAEKFVTAGAQLTTKQFDHYLKRFREIEAMSGEASDLAHISSNIGATFEDMQRQAYESAAATRNILTEADGGISSDALIYQVQEAINKMGNITGETKRRAGQAGLDLIKDIEKMAQAVEENKSVFEQLKFMKPRIKLDGHGNVLPPEAIVSDISMTDVKSIIQDLDAEIVSTNKLLGGENAKTRLYMDIRKGIDDNLLKLMNPEYEEAMLPVAARMDTLDFIQNRLSANKRYGVVDKFNEQKLRGIASNPGNNERHIQALKRIDEEQGTKYLENVSDRYYFDLMKQDSTRGSSKAMAGASLGGIVGSIAGLAAQGDSTTKLLIAGGLTAIGGVMGRMADVYGRPAVRSAMVHLTEAAEFSKKFKVKIKQKTDVMGVPLLKNATGKLYKYSALKYFKAGIASSAARRYVGGDYESFTDEGDIKIKDHADVAAALGLIALDKTLSTVDRYTLSQGLQSEWVHNNYISLQLEDTGTSKVLKGKKIPEDFFKKGKK